MLSIGIQTVDGEERIQTNLVGPLLDSDTMIKGRGGIVVIPDDEVRLFGQVRHSYRLSKSIPANIFTSLKFSYNEIGSVRHIGLCVYEEYDGFLVKSTKHCFFLNGHGNLSYNDNVEYTQLNLALKQPTRQSSTTGKDSPVTPGDSGFAVDGNIFPIFKNDDWEFNSVTRTKPEIEPFWDVDLQKDRIIRKVVIYKRMDIYDDDLRDFTITVRDSNNYTMASVIYHDAANATTIFEFDDIIGRTLTIQLNGNYPRVLCLAEVQVYGSIYSFVAPIGVMLDLPAMNINHFSFLQDQSFDGLDSESSVIADIMFSTQAHNSKTVVSFEENNDSLGVRLLIRCFNKMNFCSNFIL